MLSYRNTQKEIEESGVDTAIIPLGSTEQHSSHLPIGTDAMVIEKIAEKVAEHFNALLLPVLPISTCYEHKGKKGNCWMRPSTYYQMLQDIVLCLRSQGFKKVFLLVGHGGIFIAGPATRELNAMYDDISVIKVDPTITPEMRDVLDNKDAEIHAGESETSMVLYLFEDLVKKDLMMHNDCQPDVPRDILNSVPIHRFSPTGAWGKSSLATVEKGEKLFNLRVKAYIEYIEKALELIGDNHNAW